MKLKEDFRKWLETTDIHSVQSEGSLDSYCWPLNQTYNGHLICSNSTNLKYEALFQYLLAEGNYDWIDRILEEFDNFHINNNKNHRSYFVALKHFLQGDARCLSYDLPQIKILKTLSKSKAPKLYVKYPSFEGMTALLSKLSVNDILELTFQSALFFDKSCAEESFSTLLKKCDSGEIVYARGDNRKCPQYPNANILKDTDGNKANRDFVKTKFGYTLSGNNRNFYGYTISHIWGNANNPLFFTNLINLALIPDWINHLLDKYSSAGSVNLYDISPTEKKALQIVNTIRKAAYEYYGINNLIAPTVLSANDFPIQQNLVIKGKYSINLIKPKNSEGALDYLHGSIVHSSVEI